MRKGSGGEGRAKGKRSGKGGGRGAGPAGVRRTPAVAKSAGDKEPTPASLGRSFPGLRRRDGCGAMLLVAERVGGGWDASVGRCEVGVAVAGGGGRAVGGRLGRVPARVCQALAAFGHGQRVKIMAKLLEGPATYRALQRITKLKAGPLYHHINQLRLARLILPKQRDLYELTRGGRNLILAVAALGPLIRDPRRRPVSRNADAVSN